MPLLTDLFRRRYLASLDDYKSFYDDLAVYGDPRGKSRALYFVPGFNGVPGQIRFALPSLTRLLGGDLYVRCLHLPEFSARQPIWDKYTPDNVAAKRAKLVADVTELAAGFDEVFVFVSSSGFYDFLAAYADLPTQVLPKLRLVWVACAPDWAEESPWEPVFYRLNGFEQRGFSWFAYPNHNWLLFINNECTADKRWQLGRQKKTFFKNDLESRFALGRVLWDYISIDCYNWHTETNLAHARPPIDIPAVVLVATEDGYWQGRSKEVIRGVIGKYLTDVDVLYRATTHLWVTVPENITAALRALDEKVGLIG